MPVRFTQAGEGQLGSAQLTDDGFQRTENVQGDRFSVSLVESMLSTFKDILVVGYGGQHSIKRDGLFSQMAFRVINTHIMRTGYDLRA